MNPTTKKLKKLFKNSTYLGPDDPIYKEPAGILFTGLFRKPGKKPKKASKPKKQKSGETPVAAKPTSKKGKSKLG